MEILAGLVTLNKENTLPVPWFNRPALGLVTNTTVRLGVVESGSRAKAPPEILVTPLQTDRIACTASLTVDYAERPGVLNAVLAQVGRELNIALLESLTLDGRERHRITLQLEPKDIDPENPERAIAHMRRNVDRLVLNLPRAGKLLLADGQILAASYPNQSIRFLKQETSVVRLGEMNDHSILEYVQDGLTDEMKEEYDFARVVVSSSTEGRYIRYVFPRRGVFEATISHLDEPGTLEQVSRRISGMGYNVLMARLSRSNRQKSSQPGKSIFFMVCEPDTRQDADRKGYREQVKARIKESLRDAPSAYQLEVASVSTGRSIEAFAFPNIGSIDPTLRQIRAQDEIALHFNRYQDRPGRKIFVSYRKILTQSGLGKLIREAVFNGIRDADCIPYDGFDQPEPVGNHDSSDVRARMWHCAAAFFVAVDEHRVGNLSGNQLIEWGYNFGQGKPYASVVIEGRERNVAEFMMPNHPCLVVDVETEKNQTVACEKLRREVKEQIGLWFGAKKAAA